MATIPIEDLLCHVCKRLCLLKCEIPRFYNPCNIDPSTNIIVYKDTSLTCVNCKKKSCINCLKETHMGIMCNTCYNSTDWDSGC